MEVVMNTRMQSDVWIYRLVVVVLGVAVIASVIGAIMLALAGQSTPEVLVALGSAAVGGLAGLLAPSPLHRR
jgi:hypothetical protein